MDRVKVFLIDDDPDDRMLFQVALEEACIQCDFTAAEDGLDALRSFNDPGFAVQDVIFLDINMPRMNGKELLPKLKALQKHRDTPVIVYSTSSSVPEIRKMLDAGAHTYLTKPHSFKQMCADVIKTLQDLDLHHA